MFSLKRYQGLSSWSVFAISFTVFVSFSIASPQIYNRGASANPVVTLSLDGNPPITVPVNTLFEFEDSFIYYYQILSVGSVGRVDIVSGPPDVGCLFINTRADGTELASNVAFTPETKKRYPSASETIRGPFKNPNYLVFFRLPGRLDPNQMMAVLTSEIDYDMSFDDPGLHIYFLSFAGPEARGKYTTDRFDGIVTIRKAALVHAPNPRSRVQVISVEKTEITDITPQDQMKEPMERAKFMIGGEEPPPGLMLSQEQLDEL